MTGYPTETDREGEVRHVKKALTANGYRSGLLRYTKKREKVADPSRNRTQWEGVYPVCIPYVAGVSERLHACSRHTV